MANCAICLAHMIDKALATTIATKDEEFVIPGRLVGGGDTRIAFFGEHVACSYWFYQ